LSEIVETSFQDDYDILDQEIIEADQDE